MTTEQILLGLSVLLAIALIASWVAQFRVSSPGSRVLTDSEPETRDSDPSHHHVWVIAAREETAGRSRVISRCSECGSIEVREVA